jgi:hypothetical protein
MSIYTYKNLYRAYLDCRKNKRKTINALKFELNLEENLMALLKELRQGIYRPGRSICFVVKEPTPREIFAADFRDRIVHHLFVGELIGSAEKLFIFDSFACRKGKGTHRAVKRLYKFMQRAAQNSRRKIWFMKLDLKSFFMSINHEILYSIVLALIEKEEKSIAWKREMAALAKILIFHKPAENYLRKGNLKLAKLIPANKSLLYQPPRQGLPIGNYTSQFFANLYLNGLDHFIKRQLKCGYYLRYVDDLVFLADQADTLKNYREKIKNFIKTHLRLAINNSKTIIQPIERGIDFLGYFLKTDRAYVRRQVLKRYKNKLFRITIGKLKTSRQHFLPMFKSYEGHFKFALSLTK